MQKTTAYTIDEVFSLHSRRMFFNKDGKVDSANPDVRLLFLLQRPCSCCCSAHHSCVVLVLACNFVKSARARASFGSSWDNYTEFMKLNMKKVSSICKTRSLSKVSALLDQTVMPLSVPTHMLFGNVILTCPDKERILQDPEMSQQVQTAVKAFLVRSIMAERFDLTPKDAGLWSPERLRMDVVVDRLLNSEDWGRKLPKTDVNEYNTKESTEFMLLSGSKSSKLQ